jgi:mono/diheme cytochrome c family protein
MFLGTEMEDPMRMHFVALALALVACGGDKGSTGASGDTGAAGTNPTGGDDAEAAALYANHCAACHGADGEGGGVAPEPMSVYVSGSTQAEISAQIQNGGGSMPAITALTAAEADAVAAWSLSEFGN